MLKQYKYSNRHLLFFVLALGLIGGYFIVPSSKAAATVVTGASLAACATNPCTTGTFVHNFTTCGSTPQILAGNVIQLGAINNYQFNENYCYAWYKPANINSTPAATVMLFGHCAGSGCAGSVVGNGWQWLADHNALNIVYFYSPQDRTTGIAGYTYHIDSDYPGPPNASVTPPCSGTTSPGGCSDEPAIAAVVNDLVQGMGASKINVDPQRIYTLGASSGGSIQIDLACSANTGIIRGSAIVSAHLQLATDNPGGATGSPVSGSERCPNQPTQPYFLLQIHGSNDTAVPFNGICNFGTAKDHCVASDTEERLFYAADFGCSSTPIDTNFGSPTAANIKHTYNACANGAKFVAETITGGGHTDCALNDLNVMPAGVCPAASGPHNGFFTAQEAWNFWASSQWSTNTAKPGDLNADNLVDILDLSILLRNYKTNNAVADVNNDGTVDGADLTILLGNYGT